MNLYELTQIIKHIALKQPNVRTAKEGSVYDIMNANPAVEYDAVVITQGTHTQDEQFNHFSFNLFYVSRLVDNMENNRLQAQSIGVEVLSNIVQFLNDVYDIENDGDLTFNTFTEKFADECAGCYAKITFVVPKEIYCGEGY